MRNCVKAAAAGLCMALLCTFPALADKLDSGKAVPVNLELDSSGEASWTNGDAEPAEEYSVELWRLTNGEWKRYTLTHQWKSAVAAPLIFSAASTVPATCYIDGVQWEAGKTATEYAPPIVEGALVTSAPDNFVEYGKPVDAQLDIVCAPGTKGNVTVKVRDFFDTVKFHLLLGRVERKEMSVKQAAGELGISTDKFYREKRKLEKGK